MADLPEKKPVPSNMRMSPIEDESVTGFSDLPKKKGPARKRFPDKDLNDYLENKTTKDQYAARVDDRYGRKDPMEDTSILEEQERLSQNMKKIGFEKGGIVTAKRSSKRGCGIAVKGFGRAGGR